LVEISGHTLSQPDHSPILNNRWLSGIMILIISGCSHPGVGCIIVAASTFGKVSTLIGGLHGFDGYPLIDGLDAIYTAHCTRHSTPSSGIVRKNIGQPEPGGS
jgi:metal-dependent hydrolase (beta-lactamase superfamily II)